MTVVTDIPSPHQVELFNAITEHGAFKFRAVYARSQDGARPWPNLELHHEACFLDHSGESQAQAWIEAAELAVFSGYRIPGIQQLMRLRNNHGKPWAFWGERPGFRFAGVLGRILRRWPMRLIHTSKAPIWGIGQWAVEGYREELGVADRLYINVPYFADLDRFDRTAGERRMNATCRFLFSGQLVRRKGVDVLIEAFSHLVREKLPVELHLLGDGPLREKLHQAAGEFAQQVVFHGYQSWQSIPDYYRDAGILCVPSRHDGWAMVVAEGLAAGLPVIASDRTGAARQLINSDNGWLIPAGDATALHAAMRQAALCNAEQYQHLSANARETAKGQNLTVGGACFSRAVDQSLEYWRQLHH